MKYNRLLALIITLFLVAGVCFYFTKNNKISTFLVSESNKEQQKSDNVASIIVPHHDLAKQDRADLFAKVKNNVSAKTIVLVSTNHFNTGNSNIITTNKSWDLSGGKIEPNESIINELVKANVSANDENAFSDEHGIRNILPDILSNFAGKKIVPIIIKPGTSDEDITKLSDILIASCKNDCLLVSSVDFSHYQPGALAEIHDDLSIRALQNLDQTLLSRTEVDSRETLLLTILFSKSEGAEKFDLYKDTNSGEMAKERDSESTSYVLGWYEKGEIVKSDDSFTFMIGGDMMFDRNIEYTFQGKKIYDCFKNFGNRVFSGTDLSVVNLEGPISPTLRTPVSDHSLVFNFQPNTPDILSWLGINAVSLANNHTLNNGAKGLSNTKKVLVEKGISYVGQDATFNDESTKVFENGSSIKLSVMTIDTLNTDTNIEEKIAKEKEKGNYVLIVPHWGTEYEPIHSKSQENMAHSWINAGADFVIGGHPHVIQDAEVYKGKPIFYSLGNLLFDQDFSPETQRGLVLAFKIKKTSIDLVLLPTISKKYKPELLIGAEKTAFLAKFRKYLGAPEVEQNYGYDTIHLGAK